MKKQYEEPKAEVVKADAVYAGNNGNGNGHKGQSNNKNNGKAWGHTSAYGRGNNDKWD